MTLRPYRPGTAWLSLGLLLTLAGTVLAQQVATRSDAEILRLQGPAALAAAHGEQPRYGGKFLSTTLLVWICMRYPLIKKEDTHGYTRQSSLVARVGRVFGHLPGALPSPGGRGRLGALPDRVAHRIAQQELRHYGGGRPRDQ